MRRLLFFAALSAIALNANSQNRSRNISGVVKSSEELTPLEGVTITIKGTKKISGTQPDGAFYIDVDKQDSVIAFTMPGFEPREIRLTASNDYAVVLIKSSPGLYIGIMPPKKTADSK